MKVLSLKEPWASLILKKIKIIETRSWKTNYRGELYIHASLTPMDKKTRENLEIQELIKKNSINFNRGFIIGKCILKDCIYMTEEYIQQIKSENYENYICGNYQVGRYAWIIENAEFIDNPIPAKGWLGIWNYNEIGDDNNVKRRKCK